MSGDVEALFSRTYGTSPAGVWSAPGRVNLIGEHTDYNEGLVLPFAIDARARIAAARSGDDVISVVSAQQDTVVHRRSIAELDPALAAADGWAGYVFGVVWVFREAGLPVAGLNLAVDSTVPVGAGLSSSAALECATALAAAELGGADLDLPAVARLAQRAENDYVGVPCGLMDQMASAACTAGHLLFFDVRAESIEHVPFDPAAAGLRVLIADTRVKHSLTDGEYAKRRASCEQAAAELGVGSLRELSPADLPRLQATLSTGELRRRATHVVTENDRVERTVALLAAGGIGDIGPLLTASHVSLRDDYEVSDPALDVAVDTALEHGALGARMTGGGFGGSAIALVPAERAAETGDAIVAAFAERGWRAPVIRNALPSAGATRDAG